MAKVSLDPYLFFMGNCKDAMEFYKGIFGGELNVSLYDSIPGDKPENSTGKVMHASLAGGEIDLMASDSTRTEPFAESFISLSLSGTDIEKLTGLFDQLADGGIITSALKKESWGDTFGTLTDKFGVDWMVNIGTDAKV